MRIIELYNKALKSMLSAEEEQYLLDLIEKYPYYSFLYVILAINYEKTNHPNYKKIKSMAVVYAPDAIYTSMQLKDKLRTVIRLISRVPNYIKATAKNRQTRRATEKGSDDTKKKDIESEVKAEVKNISSKKQKHPSQEKKPDTPPIEPSKNKSEKTEPETPAPVTEKASEPSLKVKEPEKTSLPDKKEEKSEAVKKDTSPPTNTTKKEDVPSQSSDVDAILTSILEEDTKTAKEPPQENTQPPAKEIKKVPSETKILSEKETPKPPVKETSQEEVSVIPVKTEKVIEETNETSSPKTQEKIPVLPEIEANIDDILQGITKEVTEPEPATEEFDFDDILKEITQVTQPLQEPQETEIPKQEKTETSSPVQEEKSSREFPQETISIPDEETKEQSFLENINETSDPLTIPDEPLVEEKTISAHEHVTEDMPSQELQTKKETPDISTEQKEKGDTRITTPSQEDEDTIIIDFSDSSEFDEYFLFVKEEDNITPEITVEEEQTDEVPIEFEFENVTLSLSSEKGTKEETSEEAPAEPQKETSREQEQKSEEIAEEILSSLETSQETSEITSETSAEQKNEELTEEILSAITTSGEKQDPVSPPETEEKTPETPVEQGLSALDKALKVAEQLKQQLKEKAPEKLQDPEETSSQIPRDKPQDKTSETFSETLDNLIKNKIKQLQNLPEQIKQQTEVALKEIKKRPNVISTEKLDKEIKSRRRRRKEENTNIDKESLLISIEEILFGETATQEQEIIPIELDMKDSELVEDDGFIMVLNQETTSDQYTFTLPEDAPSKSEKKQKAVTNIFILINEHFSEYIHPDFFKHTLHLPTEIPDNILKILSEYTKSQTLVQETPAEPTTTEEKISPPPSTPVEEEFDTFKPLEPSGTIHLPDDDTETQPSEEPVTEGSGESLQEEEKQIIDVEEFTDFVPLEPSGTIHLPDDDTETQPSEKPATEGSGELLQEEKQIIDVEEFTDFVPLEPSGTIHLPDDDTKTQPSQDSAAEDSGELLQEEKQIIDVEEFTDFVPLEPVGTIHLPDDNTGTQTSTDKQTGESEPTDTLREITTEKSETSPEVSPEFEKIQESSEEKNVETVPNKDDEIPEVTEILQEIITGKSETSVEEYEKVETVQLISSENTSSEESQNELQEEVREEVREILEEIKTQEPETDFIETPLPEIIPEESTSEESKTSETSEIPEHEETENFQRFAMPVFGEKEEELNASTEDMPTLDEFLEAIGEELPEEENKEPETGIKLLTEDTLIYKKKDLKLVIKIEEEDEEWLNPRKRPELYVPEKDTSELSEVKQRIEELHKEITQATQEKIKEQPVEMFSQLSTREVKQIKKETSGIKYRFLKKLIKSFKEEKTSSHSKDSSSDASEDKDASGERSINNLLSRFQQFLNNAKKPELSEENTEIPEEPEVAPSYSKPTETLARIFEKRGNYQEAIRIYEKLISLFPEKETLYKEKILKLQQK